ncbi:hypothetical protein GW17_00009569 [Ensete ventricosum]|nr:hypothetical protein GW17_00009569 [Ensete ventricosum]
MVNYFTRWDDIHKSNNAWKQKPAESREEPIPISPSKGLPLSVSKLERSHGLQLRLGESANHSDEFVLCWPGEVTQRRK